MDGKEIAHLELREKTEKPNKPEEITPEMIRSASVRIGGREIPLAYDLRAQILIDEEIGMTWDELRDNINRLKGNKNTKTALRAIRILGNRGLAKAGKEPDLTEDWLMDHISMKNMLAYKVAILGTLTNGWYMETENSEEGEVDVGLMEIRKKNESIS